MGSFKATNVVYSAVLSRTNLFHRQCVVVQLCESMSSHLCCQDILPISGVNAVQSSDVSPSGSGEYTQYTAYMREPP